MEKYVHIGIVGIESWNNNPWTKKYLIKLVGDAIEKSGVKENINTTSEPLGRLVYIAADQNANSATHLLPLVAKHHKLRDYGLTKTEFIKLTRTEGNPNYIFNSWLSNGSFDAIIIMPPNNKYHNDLLAKLKVTEQEVKKNNCFGTLKIPIIING